MAAMTMDHLSGGRFVLGLGVSGPQVVEGWYGMPFAKPLARTREYIGILRDIWARKGPVTNDGEHYPLPLPDGTGLGKPLKSSIHPLREDIPIFLGAEGPKNIALAAELCDGWLAMLFSPGAEDFYGGAGRGLRARRARGAAPRTSRSSPTVPLIVSDDVEQARRRAAAVLRPVLRRHGREGAQLPRQRRRSAWATRRWSTRSRTSTWTARRTRPARRSRAELIERALADRPAGQDPRRPRAVARVDRHHAARAGDAATVRAAAEIVLG